MELPGADADLATKKKVLDAHARQVHVCASFTSHSLTPSLPFRSQVHSLESRRQMIFKP